MKIRERWIAGVATYQAEPYPRPVGRRAVSVTAPGGAFASAAKPYWAIERAFASGSATAQLHHHQGNDRKHN